MLGTIIIRGNRFTFYSALKMSTTFQTGTVAVEYSAVTMRVKAVTKIHVKATTTWLLRHEITKNSTRLKSPIGWLVVYCNG